MNDAYYFITFFLGVLLVVGAAMLGIGAFEYEVVSLGEVDGPPDGTRFVTYESQQGFEDATIVLVQYEELSKRDRRIVDRVIAGERIVFRESGDLPGKYATKGRFAVQRDGTTYLINRHLFFNWRTPFGLGAILLGVVGLATVSESIRRQQFAHRPVYWVSR